MGSAGSKVGVIFFNRRNKKFRAFQTKRFQKLFKAMKNLYFLNILQEILRFFLIKFLSKLSWKFRENI